MLIFKNRIPVFVNKLMADFTTGIYVYFCLQV